MLKKILKYVSIFLLVLITLIYVYLTQFFGKKLEEKEVENYIYHNEDTSLKIRYFGTMCFYLEYNGQAILTDPFFSNPNPLSLFYHQNVDEKYLQLFSKEELNKLNTILVGHAHYDHCLELPLFINKSTPVNILGNQSVVNLFQYKYPKNNYIRGEVFLNDKQYFYNQDSTIRIYFIDTKHGPHFGNTVLMNGENEPQKSPSTNLLDWQCGKSMSYIVDFVKHDSIEKRIVINGGKMNFPSFTKDNEVAAAHKADVIVLLGWNKDELSAKFEMIKPFKTNTVILGHWNNFFNSRNGLRQYIRKSALPETLNSINAEQPDFKTQIILPEELKD